jgi:hypothetical protein
MSSEVAKMKKYYHKPLICVEEIALDQPIAANCNANPADIRSLQEFGYFMEGRNCMVNLLPTGGFDHDGDLVADSHNTLCYHSNVQTAFLS